MSKSSLKFDGKTSAFGDMLQGQIEQSFQKAEPTVKPVFGSVAANNPVSEKQPKKSKFGKKLVVRINTEYVDLLDKKANSDGISLNTAINQAIREYLNK